MAEPPFLQRSQRSTSFFESLGEYAFDDDGEFDEASRQVIAQACNQITFLHSNSMTPQIVRAVSGAA